MTQNDEKWDMARVQALREKLSDSEIEALRAKEAAAPGSLTLDEMSVLYLVTRERIKAMEREARGE